MRRAALLFLMIAPAAAQDWTIERVQSVRPEFLVAASRVLDIDGDGRAELLLIGVNGEVRTWLGDPKTRRLEENPRGELRLPDPKHTLVAFAGFLDERPQLVALSRKGATLYRVGESGLFSSEGLALASRAKFKLRTGMPVFAEIVQDINGDKRPDLLVPDESGYALWINRTREGRAPRLQKMARIAADVSRFQDSKDDELSDTLVSSFSIPRLETVDVNGDGRLDVFVVLGRTRAFHMQRKDGTIPTHPDVVLDLRIFRDTAPVSALRPGRILAGANRAQYQSRDLDQDGIPDYVIGHRRKVWVFHGRKTRPQFTEPSTILKVSDDVSALLLTHLDDDAYPDLLIFKMHIPSVATLMVGAFKSFTVDIYALGYASEKGRDFNRAPRWKSKISVTLPSILSLAKNPGKLLDRVEGIQRKFGRPGRGDLDGDGNPDTLIVSEDQKSLRLWKGTKTEDEARDEFDLLLRRQLFERGDQSWTLDEILGFFEALGSKRTTRLTGGGPPNATLELRDATKFEFVDYALGDLDGDGAQEIVIRYEPAGFRAAPVFDVFRVAR